MVTKNKAFNLKKMAKDILAKRNKEDLSFRQIETKTGINKAILYRIEAEKGAPSIDVLPDICNWLGVDVQTYF
jgi:transcriptional regulator with XRE-family HTH domain